MVSGAFFLSTACTLLSRKKRPGSILSRDGTFATEIKIFLGIVVVQFFVLCICQSAYLENYSLPHLSNNHQTLSLIVSSVYAIVFIIFLFSFEKPYIIWANGEIFLFLLISSKVGLCKFLYSDSERFLNNNNLQNQPK